MHWRTEIGAFIRIDKMEGANNDGVPGNSFSTLILRNKLLIYITTGSCGIFIFSSCGIMKVNAIYMWLCKITSQ